ncbi:MAG: hypothetical protein FDW93_02515 [Bergeyella sp.]|nr:hypothetical protein [Bergeyella sp.]
MIIGFLLGGLFVYLIKEKFSKKPLQVRESSHTIVEGIRKAFKVVSAERYFNEIYNYEETKKNLRFIPSTKRALVIV